MKTYVGMGCLLGVLGAASGAFGQVVKLGAMGDSLTDEYAEESYSYAKNWLEQVELYRGVNVGPTAAEAGQSGGTWGEPRRRFFKHNWARSGATSTSLLSSGQHTGLAGQFATDGVTHSVLLIGANDFSPTSSAFFNIYHNLWSQTTINNYINTRVSNVQLIAGTIMSSGMRLMVSNFLDYSVAPISRTLYPDPAKRERVSTVVREVNVRIRAMARNLQIPLVDVHGLTTAIYGTNADLNDTFWIGGQAIGLEDEDTTGNTNKLAGLVHDGVHPHTTLQGLFANVMMTGANICWNAGYEPFSEQEILSHAGVAYLGVDQVAGQLGSYADYITNYACLTDFDKSGFVDFEDFDAFVQAFELGGDDADYDGSGFVDLEDFNSFVTDFEIGCP